MNEKHTRYYHGEAGLVKKTYLSNKTVDAIKQIHAQKMRSLELPVWMVLKDKQNQYHETPHHLSPRVSYLHKILHRLQIPRDHNKVLNLYGLFVFETSRYRAFIFRFNENQV